MKKLIKAGAALFGAVTLMEIGTYLACMGYVIVRNGENYVREVKFPDLVKDTEEEHLQLYYGFTRAIEALKK